MTDILQRRKISRPKTHEQPSEQHPPTEVPNVPLESPTPQPTDPAVTATAQQTLREARENSATTNRPKRAHSVMPTGLRVPEMVTHPGEKPDDQPSNTPKDHEKARIAISKREEEREADESHKETASPSPDTTGRTTRSDQPTRGKERWEQRHSRVTWYVENGQLSRIRTLHENGRIRSFTALVNTALAEYLDRHFKD